MRTLLLVLAISTWISVPTVSCAEAAAWITGCKAASARAADTKRPILADFSGSDWCEWCMKLKREVFDTPEFTAWAQRSVVLLDVDFPKSNTLTDAQQKENQALADKHGVDSFPTVILMAADGTEIGRLGYQPGGPTAWIAAAEALLAQAPSRRNEVIFTDRCCSTTKSTPH